MSRMTTAICLSVLVSLVLSGCSVPGGDLADKLTEREAKAVKQATKGAVVMVMAAGAMQSGTSARDADLLDNVDENNEEGGCPSLAAGSTGEGLLDFAFEMSFGDGCEPVWLPGEQCRGSASLELKGTARGMTVEFDDLACADLAIDGDADVDFDRVDNLISLSGDWNLSLIDGDDVLGTVGTGVADYAVLDGVINIPEFDGTVTENEDVWSMIVDALAISWPEYESFVPYAGEITVSGVDIRQLSIRFSEESPTQAKVEVSIGGSRYITIDIDDLVEDLS